MTKHPPGNLQNKEKHESLTPKAPPPQKKKHNQAQVGPVRRDLQLHLHFPKRKDLIRLEMRLIFGRLINIQTSHRIHPRHPFFLRGLRLGVSPGIQNGMVKVVSLIYLDRGDVLYKTHGCFLQNAWNPPQPPFFFLMMEPQWSLYYQPKQCIGIREIPQSYHRFVLFDSQRISNLTTPEPRSWVTWDPVPTESAELSSAQNEIPSLYHPSQSRQGTKGIGPNELWFLEWRLGCIQVYLNVRKK